MEFVFDTTTAIPGDHRVRTFAVHPSPAQSPSWSDSTEPAAAIVAKHTATKLRQELNTAYVVQSILTGFPLMVVDAVVTSCVLILSSYVINLTQGHVFNPGTWHQLPALLMLQVGLISLHQLYPGTGASPVEELRGVVKSTFLAFFCLSAINLLFGQLPRTEFAVFACAGVGVAVLLPLARYFARERLAKTSWWGIRTLLIGSPHDCQRVWRKTTPAGPRGTSLRRR